MCSIIKTSHIGTIRGDDTKKFQENLAIDNLNDIDEERLAAEQVLLASKAEISPLSLQDIRYVAGVDCAYWEDGEFERCVCSAVIYDIEKREIIEKASSPTIVDFPYISGFLAYREGKVMLETLSKLAGDIDVILVDGNGMLHERRAGEAVLIGVETGIPTLGIAKKYCRIDGAEHELPGDKTGEMSDVIVGDEVIGRALRTHRGVNCRPGRRGCRSPGALRTHRGVKPIYVSLNNSRSFIHEVWHILYDIVNNTG